MTTAEQLQQREAHKQKLWGNRLVLVKQGSMLVKLHLFGEAAVSYEKYLRILELIYDSKPNGLTPALFKNSARTAELSVIAGIYWDLVRIYDTNSAYLSRQKMMAEQLAKFSIYTPLHQEIMRKAQIFQKNCKQPDVISKMIASSSKAKTRCFIATAAFESSMAVEVQTLRFFRDQSLRGTWLGRQFIFYYYKYSPYVACFLDKHSSFKPVVRGFLKLVIKCVT